MRANRGAHGRRRNDAVAERMRERSEGSADIEAVVQRRRLAVVRRCQRNFMLGVRQAVQQRRVLGEQQREDQQQGAEQPHRG